MKTNFNPTRNARLCAGFSLVEVTIAVAIAALGFTTLMGLLPSSINMAKESAQMSTGARIIQKLTGELQSAEWADITWKGYGPVRYFTSEGAEITPSESLAPDQLATQIAYVASVQLPDQPLDVMLPAGGAGTQITEPYLRRVRVCVAGSNDPEFDFAKASPMRITSATALIARMGIN